jgi:hypothetical protein
VLSRSRPSPRATGGVPQRQVSIRHPASLGCLVQRDGRSAPSRDPGVATGIGYFPDGLLQAVAEPVATGTLGAAASSAAAPSGAR